MIKKLLLALIASTLFIQNTFTAQASQPASQQHQLTFREEDGEQVLELSAEEIKAIALYNILTPTFLCAILKKNTIIVTELKKRKRTFPLFWQTQDQIVQCRFCLKEKSQNDLFLTSCNSLICNICIEVHIQGCPCGPLRTPLRSLSTTNPNAIKAGSSFLEVHIIEYQKKILKGPELLTLKTQALRKTFFISIALVFMLWYLSRF